MKKRIAKIVAGVLAIVIGLTIIALGIYGVCNGQIYWLGFVAAGVGLVIAGWSLAQNTSFKDFFEMVRDVLGV